MDLKDKVKEMLKSSKIWIIVLCGGIITTIIAVIGISTTINSYTVSEKIYQQAVEDYVTSSVETETEEAWWDEEVIDLANAVKEYPDIIGWIYFENDNINYPIMYSGDNKKYLRTAFNGEDAVGGSIFMDQDSDKDFSDPHTIIYGHNMKDLSMFGKLKKYRTEEDYYNGHQFFQVFTKDRVMRYQIFAYEEVPTSHSLYATKGAHPEGMAELVMTLQKDSIRPTGVAADASDHILTLSTCTNDSKKRMVVSAVRIAEHDL